MKRTFARLLGPLTTLPLSLLMAIMILALAGCKQDATVDAGANPVGNYTLVTVNGNKVPCSVVHDGHSIQVKSGVFVISADKTCSSKVAFSAPNGSDASREVKASYTQQGSTLTMKWEGAGMTTGTVQGDTFTMNNEGMVFVYRK